ncbi:PREDICTED: NAC domain-containing protein 16-like, partial [Camelina sativa]|uniref:NAC domain-containing protein 16-like n=1 Tax=Camelina sativa TaxID=90675 RepID=A0ABM0X573_CAMSA
RAPNGERTDWVMHEYTMDEDELGRCKNAKEYYALYKLYKKSGAGPKNGEQYGAPFQEEEWVDSDSEEGDNVAVPDDPAVVHYDNCRRMDDPVFNYDNCRRMDDTKFCNPVNVRLQDIENLLNEIPDAPGVTTRQFNGFTGVPQGNSAGEIQSTLLNSSSGEFVDPRNTGVFLPNNQPYNRQSSFQSGLKSENSFEATSGMAPLLDFEKEDFIEMNDLLIPELGASSTEISTHFLNNGEVSDISEFDQLFHDISMSLDADPVFQGTSTDMSSLSNFANNTSDQRQQFLYQELDQTLDIQQNNFMHPSTTLNQFTDNMWFKDGQAVLFDQQPQSSSGVFTSHSTGVMPESMNPTVSVNAQNKEGQNGGGTKSQFSSALWELLESIPSTPASACEGPLNQTFVRMSSFSRIRFNGTSVTSRKVTVAKKRISNRGFLLLSIMGALCAIFWVFIATVGVMERPCLS